MQYQKRNIFSCIKYITPFQMKRYLIYIMVGFICGFAFSPVVINPLKNNKSLSSPYHDTLNGVVFEEESVLHPHTNENTAIADDLSKNVRVLCWVFTYPENHMEKAIHIKRTWGKKCNKLLFMSSAEDQALGTVVLPVPEGKEYSWAKTREAFKYVYEHHFDDFDWFMKADDDTYVIVENLRAMLYAYSPEYPVYFGFKYKEYVKQGYMAGGPGYVLSKEALKRLVQQALPSPDICRKQDEGAEDVEIAKCLQNVGILAGDTRDEFSRGRFFVLTPRDHLLAVPVAGYWYWEFIYYKTDEGLDCCSDHAISFHYIAPTDMYTYDYLIYHLRPFGIKFKSDVLPKMKLLDDVIKEATAPSNNNSTTKN